MNPYEVLGVPDGADEATVKHAYRELVKKYHPDKYVNNPLADLASEKLKEINKAYDMIMNKSSSDASYTGYTSPGGNTSSSGASFTIVRSLISRGLYTQAEAMLGSLPQNAEWNYLMGLCRIRSGWYNSGIEFIRNAVRMDPGNAEYQSMLNSISNSNSAYRRVNTSSGTECIPCCCVGDSFCDSCLSLICLDSCCECFGGDCISCI